MIRFLLLVTFIVWAEMGPVQARIVISYPTHHTVIQRSQQNEALLQVGGTYTIPYVKVEARLVSLPQGGSSSGAWTALTTPLGQGVFWGALRAKGGWYRLELRGVSESGKADTASVQPVGIGEVFLIAGHSNAMGLPRLGSKDGSERVVSFDALNKKLNADNITVAPDGPMPLPTFDQLKAEGSIFPSGESAWNWGELGTLLSDRLEVPVLFMNAAWAAANSINWREAAEGKNTLNIYVGKNWPNRQPYSNLINTLRYYHSWLGIRAVLWFHGENDAFHLKIAQQDYFTNMRRLIELTRKDFGQNLTWAIALCSISQNINDPYLPVVNAQVSLSEIPGFNVWRGPFTDSIQVPRPSHGHFENVKGGTQGLTQVAQAWNRNLTDAFFAKSPAFTPASYLSTGLVPHAASPGHSFLLPFQLMGQEAFSSLEVHLLDQAGNFVSSVGKGTRSPLRVTLPTTLPEGNYRVRVVALNPTLPGSASEVFRVKTGLAAPQPIRSLEIGTSENQVRVHALVSASPDITRLILERSDDGQTFQSMGILPAQPANASTSALYTFTDTQLSPQTTYYRIRLEGTTQEVQYSALLANFVGDSPPVLIAFPNPATPGEPIYLRTDIPDEATFQLFDTRGTLIPVHVTESAIIGLSLLQPATPLPSGMYLLQVTRGTSIRTHRLMIR